jgi:hypothetical protein
VGGISLQSALSCRREDDESFDLKSLLSPHFRLQRYSHSLINAWADLSDHSETTAHPQYLTAKVKRWSETRQNSSQVSKQMPDDGMFSERRRPAAGFHFEPKRSSETGASRRSAMILLV